MKEFCLENNRLTTDGEEFELNFWFDTLLSAFLLMKTEIKPMQNILFIVNIVVEVTNAIQSTDSVDKTNANGLSHT